MGNGASGVKWSVEVVVFAFAIFDSELRIRLVREGDPSGSDVLRLPRKQLTHNQTIDECVRDAFVEEAQCELHVRATPALVKIHPKLDSLELRYYAFVRPAEPDSEASASKQLVWHHLESKFMFEAQFATKATRNKKTLLSADDATAVRETVQSVLYNGIDPHNPV